MQAKLPKKKFDDMFGRGVRVSLDPGQVTIDGSPLWEKIVSESKEIHIKQVRQGFINVLRLDQTGKLIARLEHLHADIEGGLDEWRFRFNLPSRLVGIEFALDIGAIRDNPTSRLHLRSTLKYQNHLAAYRGVPLATLGYFDHAVEVFSELKDTDHLRFETGLEGIGITGGFTLPQEDKQLIAGIGLLYGSLKKARAIGNFFKIDLKIPAKLSDDDLDDIDFLYELIQGGEITSPQRIGRLRRRFSETAWNPVPRCFPSQTQPTSNWCQTPGLPFLVSQFMWMSLFRESLKPDWSQQRQILNEC